jgi:hypothetical protein
MPGIICADAGAAKATLITVVRAHAIVAAEAALAADLVFTLVSLAPT